MSHKTSEWKLIANRANAQKSTGPRTPEGKEAVKYNGLTHGLSSKLVVLPFEDQKEYDKTLAAFTEEYTPVSPTEEALVKQIADSQWKLRRVEKLEERVFSKLLEQASSENVDPFDAIAASLLAPGKGSNVLAQLTRYQSTLNRQFHQAVNQLRKVQSDRVKEYCLNLKREALHVIGGRADQSQEHKLAFHLIAEDPGCIERYVEADLKGTVAASRREREAA